MEELNRWLNAMGWDRVDLDDETLLLVESLMEKGGFNEPDFM